MDARGCHARNPEAHMLRNSHGMNRSAHLSPFRTYRSVRQDDLISFQLVIEETDLWVAAQQDLGLSMADHVRFLRGQIKSYAAIHPQFLTSLEPLEATSRDPEIIRRMCRAGQLTGVGPMAAVAGTVAQMLGEHFRSCSEDLLIENGGDTYLCSTRDRHIGILNMPDQDVRLCVPVAAREFPCSFCASSAKIGHSLSFGKADLVVVRAKDAALADAAATALANALTGAEAMDTVLAHAQGWESIGIEGVFTQCEGKIGVWGKMQLTVI
jgi:ApbE superfamily uncharacterized protein (UPF0280 family)